MKHRKAAAFLATSCLATAGLVLLLVPAVLAQSGGGYDLTWSTVDGGGAMSSVGGSYSLAGTAGQPDAGWISGGVYAVSGGFWGGGTAAASGAPLYLPLVLRGI